MKKSGVHQTPARVRGRSENRCEGARRTGRWDPPVVGQAQKNWNSTIARKLSPLSPSCHSPLSPRREQTCRGWASQQGRNWRMEGEKSWRETENSPGPLSRSLPRIPLPRRLMRLCFVSFTAVAGLSQRGHGAAEKVRKRGRFLLENGP